jgi:hypothetical protein
MSGKRDSSSTQTTEPEGTAEEVAKKKEEEDEQVKRDLDNLPQETKDLMKARASSAKSNRQKEG